MERELLTFAKIKKDLIAQQKTLYEGFGVVFLLLPLFLWLLVDCIKAGVVLPVVIASLYVLLVVGVLVWIAIDIVTRSKVLKDKKHIVIDEVTGVQEHTDYDRVTLARFSYTIHFSDFGEYTTRDKSLFDSCKCNDKFYLVLSKPHTGKILFAYNTKRYVLEGEDQNASV